MRKLFLAAISPAASALSLSGANQKFAQRMKNQQYLNEDADYEDADKYSDVKAADYEDLEDYDGVEHFIQDVIGRQHNLELLEKSNNTSKVVFGLMTNNDASDLLWSGLNTWASTPLKEDRLIVSGPSNFTMADGKNFIASECGDSWDDLPCKQAPLYIQAYARNADWLVIAHTDHYLLSRQIAASLTELNHSVKTSYAGSYGCGMLTPEFPSNERGPFCESVEKNGAFCGGAPYAISKATIAAIVEKGPEYVKRRNRDMNPWPEDISNGCIVRQHGGTIEAWLDNTNSSQAFVQGEYDPNELQLMFAEHRLFSVHDLKDETQMYAVHALITNAHSLREELDAKIPSDPA